MNSGSPARLAVAGLALVALALALTLRLAPDGIRRGEAAPGALEGGAVAFGGTRVAEAATGAGPGAGRLPRPDGDPRAARNLLADTRAVTRAARGRIVRASDGSALAGVVVRPLRPGPRGPVEAGLPVRTDATGRFRWGFDWPVPDEVAALAGEYEPVTPPNAFPIDAQEVATGLRFHGLEPLSDTRRAELVAGSFRWALDTGRTLDVEVRDASGRPVDGAVVIAEEARQLAGATRGGCVTVRDIPPGVNSLGLVVFPPDDAPPQRFRMDSRGPDGEGLDRVRVTLAPLPEGAPRRSRAGWPRVRR